MKIYNDNCENITIEEIDIDSLTPDSVKIILQINEEEEIQKEYEFPLSTSEITINDGVLTINNSFFSTTPLPLKDGIYHIKIIFEEGENFHIYKNCAFIDCNTQCLVSYVTGKSLKSGEVDVEDKAVVINMLYYALQHGSNCGCNCEELQDIYNKLKKELSDNINTDSCGC